MVTRKDLLKNVRNYSPQEIADAIRAGIVSMYDLSKETEGAFTPLLKRQVKTILDAPVISPQVGTLETPTSDAATALQQNVDTESQKTATSAPLSTPTIPFVEPAIPVVSFTEPVVQNVEPDSANSSQIESLPSTHSDKPAMFSRVFSFNGRIRRLEYGLTYLAYCLWNIPMRVMREDQISEGYAIFYLVTLFPLLWIVFAQGAKRCHDRGNSGWYQIIPFYFLWMIFAEGDSDTNEYGESPK